MPRQRGRGQCAKAYSNIAHKLRGPVAVRFFASIRLPSVRSLGVYVGREYLPMQHARIA
jgi:hypothetical protein